MMKKMLISAAFACAAFAMPALVMADDAMKAHDAMAGPSATMTMLCRPATTKETPTAMTTGTKTPLICKTVTPAMMKKGPDLSHALTPEQVDAAWRKFTESMMIVTGGG
jgi:hypothetical protein